MWHTDRQTAAVRKARALGTRTLATAALLAACGGSGPATEPTAAPDYSSLSAVVHVPFSGHEDFDRLGEMRVRVSINGGPPMTLEVDTGSVGVIVGADQIPHAKLNGPPGSIVYVSSGNELDGVMEPVTLTFVDAKGPDGKPVSAELPVLAAQRYHFHPGAVNGRKAGSKPAAPAKPSNKTPHPGMMGVGFARGKDGHPERNAFLMLAAMQAGTMRRGYTITRDGYDLGLSPKNTAGYQFEKLTDRPVSDDTAKAYPGLHDWHDGRGSVTVGDQPPVPVGILMDTGLTNFMIELPSVEKDADPAPGTKVSVDLLGGRFHYGFVTGDKSNPLAPRRVTWTHKADFALLNTGLKALAGFDYLYDADGGYLGLRPTR
jgi:hypothetical protein